MATGALEIPATAIWLAIDPLGGTNYKNLICLLTHGFNLSNSTSTVKTYCGPKTTPGDQTQTSAFTGRTVIDPLSGQISSPDLFDLAQNQTKFSWKSFPVNPLSGAPIKTGKGYFSSWNEDYSATDVAQFGGTITVDGYTTQTLSTGS